MNIERLDNEGNAEKRELSQDHLQALARGRKEASVVRHYLDALETMRPRRGRKPNLEKLRSRLVELEGRIKNSEGTPSVRLSLIQERKDLETKLSSTDKSDDLRELEDGFVEVAAAYAKRRGFDYDSFKEVGVPTEVLKRAGIKRVGANA